MALAQAAGVVVLALVAKKVRRAVEVAVHGTSRLFLLATNGPKCDLRLRGGVSGVRRTPFSLIGIALSISGPTPLLGADALPIPLLGSGALPIRC